jgi:DNA-binding XRE family transcriptional regulator
MKKSQRARLETAGWKFGGSAEFLGLSKEEVAFVELKLGLAGSLRAHRVRRRMTQAELARALHSSQSRIAKMESGDPSVSIDLLVRSLLSLGVSRREIGRIIAASRLKARRVD